MLRTPLKTLLINCAGLNNQTLSVYRYFRNVVRRRNGPKLIEGKVKTVTSFDETERIDNLRDYVDSIKKSKLGDELEVEKHFAEEDDRGHVIERCEEFYDMHLREEKKLKSVIKKGIIKRKYFNLGKETNLLTHAAKEQIRFLHESNPLQWNCKAIAECFPISEAGVKKLLKSNFSQSCPEKIKEHDEQVAERWKSLKTGKFTTNIAPLTEKLYKEGKLVDDYFGGNPNLPTTPPNRNVIHVEEKKHVGEFSAIVQTYINYKKQKLLESSEENHSENQLTLKGNSDGRRNEKIGIEAVRKFKYADEEIDDVEIHSSHRKNHLDHADLPLAQFKEIIKEEIQLNSSNNNEYKDILSDKTKSENSKKPYDEQSCFLKITKYEKSKNINASYDIKEDIKRVYKYDEKLGYQYPIGEVIKGNIQIPSKLYKKGRLYKLGQCIYDDNGTFLYTVPS